MADPELYFDSDKLAHRLGQQTMNAVFNEDGSAIDEDAVNEVIVGASARATSWFPANYNGVLPFPDPIPGLVVELALLYGQALAWDRNPDHDRAMGHKSKAYFAQADALGKNIQSAIQRMVDAPAPTPANVGGIVYRSGPSAFVSTTDGTYTGGDY